MATTIAARAAGSAASRRFASVAICSGGSKPLRGSPAERRTNAAVRIAWIASNEIKTMTASWLLIRVGKRERKESVIPLRRQA
ncbi:MAG: hypothetical protein R3D62_21650 [Xanthobacteraceae bacterium]